MEKNIKQFNLNMRSVSFLQELYILMKKFDIHRIYRISLNNNEINEAHQTIKTIIGKKEYVFNFFKFINNHFPMIYFKIFYNIHLKRYKYKLKKLLKKYNIDTITASSFSLYQGIYITNDKLCINGVDIINKDQDVYHVDKLYIDI